MKKKRNFSEAPDVIHTDMYMDDIITGATKYWKKLSYLKAN